TGVGREKVARERPAESTVLDASTVVDVLVLALEIVEPGVRRMRGATRCGRGRLGGGSRWKGDETGETARNRGEATQEGAANEGSLCVRAHDDGKSKLKKYP